MPKPITVTPRPKMILISTDAPRSSQFVEQGRWRIASTTWDSHAAQRIVGHPFQGIVEPVPRSLGIYDPGWMPNVDSAKTWPLMCAPSTADSGPRQGARVVVQQRATPPHVRLSCNTFRTFGRM